MLKPTLFQNHYQFFVNKEKKTVVVKLVNPQFLFNEYVTNQYYRNNVDVCETRYVIVLRDVISCLFSSRKEFVAKAVCSDEDDFDEDIGRKIAVQKLQIKIINSWIKIYEEIEAYHSKKLHEVLQREVEAFKIYSERSRSYAKSLKRIDDD